MCVPVLGNTLPEDAGAQRGRVKTVETDIKRLRELLEGCKRGSCWCPCGIGRPGFRTHTAHCLAVQKEMGRAQRRGDAEVDHQVAKLSRSSGFAP